MTTTPTVEERLTNVEDELKRYKLYFGGASVAIFILLGVGGFYEIPNLARDEADKAVQRQVGDDVQKRMKDLNSQFDQLADSRSVARKQLAADLRADLRHTFVGIDSPYLIVWDYKKQVRWNLDVKGAGDYEGNTVDISSNGLHEWRIIERK